MPGFDFREPKTDIAGLLQQRLQEQEDNDPLMNGIREVMGLDKNFNPIPPTVTSAPPTPETPPEAKQKGLLTRAATGAIEFAKQITLGAAGDIVTGVTSLMEDIGALMAKTVLFDPSPGRQNVTGLAESLQQGPASKPFRELLNDVVGKPSGFVTQASRQIASFMLSIAALSPVFGAVTKGRVAARLLTESGLVGLIIDPDAPRLDDMLASLTGAAAPVRDAIQEFVNGDTPEDEFAKRLRTRLVNAAEDLPLNVTFEVLFRFARALRAGRVAKEANVAAAPAEEVLQHVKPEDVKVALPPLPEGLGREAVTPSAVPPLPEELAATHPPRPDVTPETAPFPVGEELHAPPELAIEAPIPEVIDEIKAAPPPPPLPPQSLSKPTQIELPFPDQPELPLRPAQPFVTPSAPPVRRLPGDIGTVRGNKPFRTRNAAEKAVERLGRADVEIKELSDGGFVLRRSLPQKPRQGELPFPQLGLFEPRAGQQLPLVEGGVSAPPPRPLTSELTPSDIGPKSGAPAFKSKAAASGALKKSGRGDKFEVVSVKLADGSEGFVIRPKVEQISPPQIELPLASVEDMAAHARRTEAGTKVTRLPESRIARGQAALDDMLDKVEKAKKTKEPTIEVTVDEINDVIEGLDAGGTPYVPREFNDFLNEIERDLMGFFTERLKDQSGALKLSELLARRVVRALIGGGAGAVVGGGVGETINDRISNAITVGLAGSALAAFAPDIARVVVGSIDTMRPRRPIKTRPIADIAPTKAVAKKFTKLVGTPEEFEAIPNKTGVSIIRAKGGQLAVDFNAVTAETDLKKLVVETEKLFPEVKGARESLLGTTQDELEALSKATGTNIDEILAAADEPLLFSRRAKTLTMLQEASVKKIKQFAKDIIKGTPEQRARAADALTHQLGISATLARAFNMARSDFGRALNVFKHATDDTIMLSYVAGKRRTGVSVDQLAEMITELPEGRLPEFARKAASPTLGGALRELYLNILLGTTITAIKAGFGNVLSLATVLPRRALTARAARLVGAEEGPIVGEAMEGFRALAGGVMDALRLAGRTILTGEAKFVEVGGSKIEGLLNRPQFVAEAFGINRATLDTSTPLGALLNVLGAMIDQSGRFFRIAGGRPLLAGDEAAQFLLERMEYRMQAFRRTKDIGDPVRRMEAVGRIMEHPDPEIIAAAKKTKEFFTFTNKLLDPESNFAFLGNVGEGLRQIGMRSPNFRILFPFVRAMTNIPKMTLEITPGLNLISAQFRRKLFGSTLEEGGGIAARAFGRTTKAEKAEALGLLGFSAGLGMIGVTLGALGLVRGPAPNDPQLREMSNRAHGQPNAVVIGDTTIPLQADEPLGYVMSTFARLGALMFGRGGEFEENAVTGALLATTQLLRNSMFVGAIARLLDAITTGKLQAQIKRRGVGQAVGLTVDELFLKSVVPPRFFQQLTQIIDPLKRETDTLLEAAETRLPGLSTTLPVARNRFGESELRGFGQDHPSNTGVIKNTLRIFTPFNPITVDRGSPEREAALILDRNSIEVSDPAFTRTIKNQTIQLNAAERSQLLFNVNHPPGMPSFAQAIINMSKTPQWKRFKGGPESPRALMVEQLASVYNELGWRMLLNDPKFGESIRERVMEKARETGFLPPTQ